MSINIILQEIEELITPLSETHSFEDALNKKTSEWDGTDLLNLSEIDIMMSIKFPLSHTEEFPAWIQFLRILLNKLLLLKTQVEKEEELLFSVNQQKLLKSSVEILICIGVLAHLNNGIGVPINQRLPNKYVPVLQNVTLKQKYYAINLTLLGASELQTSDVFESILINRHIGDLIAGTVQIISEKESVNLEFHRKYLQNLVENTYQPFVIRALMVMLGNKGVPKKIYHWLGKVLSDRLTTKGGLVATLRAILDLTGDSKDSPHYWDHISVLAKLITTPKHVSVYPQLLSLLKGQESEYRQVAVLSLKVIAESRPNDCEKYFITPLLKPITSPSSEVEFSEALEALHACCGIPSPRSVSPKFINSGFPYLIRLHTKIRSSVSYLKSKAADLAWAILSDDETNLEDTLIKSIFSPLPLVYNFGSEGGIYTTEGTDDIDSEEVGTSILELFMEHDSAKAKINLFKVLLRRISLDSSLEKQLIYSKLLSELCNNTDIQKELSTNPLCILPFLKVLLENPDNFGSDTACLGLMVLGVVVDSPFSHKLVDWSQLGVLIEPLKNFKSSSSEANVLANELYEMILSHGVVRKNPKKQENIKTSVEKALEEAVDPLLPVRAHGIRELGKLLIAKNKQAIKKRETILFILKENLKDEDSYIYLSAIEGLAALSASFPDEVMMLLIEEYQSKTHSVEDRLKVGESLLKVARHLNEMAIIYKKELICTFLAGCCDDDPFMRSSSLSNLGEICKILSFRVTSYLVEILECVRSIYETDKYPEPRRAAVMVLTLLLKGLGENTLSTLEPVLLELYRGLKKVYEYDKDDITRLHAQLALEELRTSTVAFLNPVRPLEKRIFVLDPPL